MSEGDTIYLLIVDDRHYDTEATPYLSADNAIAAGQQLIRDEAQRFGEEPDEELNDAMRRDGWVYYGKSFDDGPKAWVVQRQVRL